MNENIRLLTVLISVTEVVSFLEILASFSNLPTVVQEIWLVSQMKFQFLLHFSAYLPCKILYNDAQLQITVHFSKQAINNKRIQYHDRLSENKLVAV